MLVQRKDLENAVRIITSCISKKSFSQVLECCKIIFSEDGLIIKATDFETAASVCVPSVNGEDTDGTIIVNAGKLASLVGKGKKGEIQISLNDDSLILGKAKLRSSTPVEEFPEIPSPPSKGCKVYQLNDDLSQALKFVSPAMAKEAMRYALNGVYLDFKRGRLAATDGKRLHCAPLGESAVIPGAIISPRLLKKVAPDSIIIPPATKTKEAGKVVKRISHLFFSIQNGICVTRIIEGEFPEYTDLIPKSCPSRIEVERYLLLQSLKRIKQISSTDPACSLNVDGSLELIVKDEEEGIECHETVPGELKGRKATVNVNPVLLHDCITGLRTERICLYFQGPGEPMLVEDKAGWFGLIMPLNTV